MKKLRQQHGFTLIEIMIAMAIMSVLTVFTARSIQDALRNSSKYRKQINETSELRDVLRVMENDIHLAFHHRNIQQELLDQIEKDKNKGKNQEEQDAQSGNAADPPVNHTHFMGETDSLYLTTLSNVRTIVDSKESDQAEVGYFLQNCKKRGSQEVEFQCLWRSTASIIDDDVTAGGVAVPILENVNALQLRYIGDPVEGELSAEPEWVEAWDSKKDDQLDRFPNAVEIRITVNRQLGEKTVPQTLGTVASLRFPNNPKPQPEPEEEETAEDEASADDEGK